MQSLSPHLHPEYLEMVLLPSGEFLVAEFWVCDEAGGVCGQHRLVLLLHIWYGVAFEKEKSRLRKRVHEGVIYTQENALV